ncbi:hypothetical protein HPB52_003053 [Rhipicephalus sanguineus]|uniref:Methylated-DNA-[protein]-cysteine S-methyltransferase DNA binding domain-containing protein n=1 Tax=Rhipicephalus sanguineus TaxID=34632 RepID=A0A9D4SRX0_RHISA|nr:hypothetical protein HPB52_003053 [Rhipicephalus sanguineus]
MKRKSCPYGPTNDYVLSSPIGRLAVKSCPHGLHSLHQMDDEANFSPDLRYCVRIPQTLSERVGPGTTVSYGELARLCNNPKAAQAVGSCHAEQPASTLSAVSSCRATRRCPGTLCRREARRRETVAA